MFRHMRVPRDTSVLSEIIIVYLDCVGKLPNSFKKTDLSNLCKISYFVLFFPFSWRPMTLVSYPILPHFEVCLPRVCTMFSFLSINSSQYHVIVNHVTVFSVFIGKSKVELCDPQREI